MFSELVDPSWPECDLEDLFPYKGNPYTMDMEFLHMGESDFSSSLTTTEEESHSHSSLAPSPSFEHVSTMYWDGNPRSFSVNGDDDQPLEITQGIILDKHDEMMIGDICRWMGGVSDAGSPSQQLQSPSSSTSTSTSPEGKQETLFEQNSYQETKLVLPTEDTELDNQLSILHLLKACGEAKEKECVELEQVIHSRVMDKSMPMGEILERLGYYCCSDDKEMSYLKHESNKKYGEAFRAFYEICPYGRFAHFTANRAILEAVPNDAESVRILDFDMGEGVQWPPLLVSLTGREVTITAVRWKEEEERRSCSFQETRRRLCEYSHSIGLKLRVEEIEMEEIPMYFSDRKRKRKRGIDSAREWVAANCMVGLPHMPSVRSTRQVLDFLGSVAAAVEGSVGIITFGSGENSNSVGSFGSYYEERLVHFHALLESMEWHLPSSHFSLARTAMECLFVVPNVSSNACFLQWKEGRSSEVYGQAFEVLGNGGFEGRPLSMGNIEEGRHIVHGGMVGGMYGVKVMGSHGNEMVLEWRRTPLVRISAWKR